MKLQMLIVVLVLVMSLVAGCQNDTEVVFRNSARFLREGEPVQARSANPYAGTWTWGNQQGMPVQ